LTGSSLGDAGGNGTERMGSMHLRIALALVGASLAALLPAAAQAATGTAWHYETQPHLQPPRLTVATHHSGLGSGLIFTAPFKNAGVASPEVGQPGALIMDTAGNPVWFQPAPGGDDDMDVQPQTYQGKPVITFWQGGVAVDNATNKAGLPQGAPEPGAHFEILNQQYRVIKTIRAQDGWTADLHEFLITPQDDAIYLVSRTVKADLTPEGGSAKGSYEDSGIQEVDLSTGKVIYTWDMAQHVPFTESAETIPSTGVWDPYHANSLFVDSDGSLLVSARNTWSVYDVSPTAAGTTINWTLDGKAGATDSTYALGSGAAFSWQHDAQLLPNGDLSLFDDHCCALTQKLTKPLPSARGEVLDLNAQTRTATVVHSYYHSPALLVPTQGSMQTLTNGDVFLDWGQQPVFSAYTAAGKLIYDAAFPAADSTYRAYLEPWVGLPPTRPAIKVVTKGANATVYVSWNGATQVTQWELLAGTGSHLKALGRVTKAGFETAIQIHNAGTVNFQIKALSSKGTTLGSSTVARG
jgi:Arylsulfotransferase (ASST)